MEMHSNLARPLHVLIVDSDDEVRRLFADFLRIQGYTVSDASDPMQALELVKVKTPDAVVSSLVFPEMNGFAFCRRLRAMPETADKLIVALTGFIANGVVETVFDAGFDRLLSKPIDLQILRSHLDTLRR